MRKKVVLMIDAGHLRAQARREKIEFDLNLVRKIIWNCIDPEVEELHKVLYYDCEGYQGECLLPVSGLSFCLIKGHDLLREIESQNLFAVRRGTLKFRGWKRAGSFRKQIGPATKDSDFQPDLQQKGVDIRIGLDIAEIANKKYVERLILISNDSDLTPAMKYARKAGLQVVLIRLPGWVNQSSLLPHVDYKRTIAWPDKITTV